MDAGGSSNGDSVELGLQREARLSVDAPACGLAPMRYARLSIWQRNKRDKQRDQKLKLICKSMLRLAAADEKNPPARAVDFPKS
jgi:hypothetical protein